MSGMILPSAATRPMVGVSERVSIVDAHVHFWDPGALHYPWLDETPKLRRSFLPPAFAAAVGGAPVDGIVFVECNCLVEESRREVELIEHLSSEPRISGIVAFADLTDNLTIDRALDRLCSFPRVKGIRQNIQGQPAGFCLQPAFVRGVEKVGARGLVFDLCATHDQLGEIAELVRRSPHTRFVLDHCGKPRVRERQFEPWATDIARLADFGNVHCKLSGLLTEADADTRRGDDLVQYAEHVLARFGIDRVMFGSDWPVLTLAGSYADWYDFSCRLTAGWSAADRQRFYGSNASRVYTL